MPYIPPHKRLSADAKTPTPSSPAADSLADRFSNSLRLGRNRRPHSLPGGKAIYAPGSASLWWPVGSRDGDEPIPASFRLERVPGAKHLVLCRNPLSEGSGSGGLDETPWETIAERIEPHLFACVQRAMEAKATAAEGEEVKLSFLARVGKVHFKEGITFDSIRKAAVAEANWNKVHKSFNTDVSDAYMEDIQHKVVPKTELGFESVKELYHVKVYDKSRPDSTISCKCTVGDGGELKIHKMELNHVRHLLVDISCLYKDMNFRLMLVNKRRLTSPDDEEKDAINKLIKSAILDPAVKGGLRWPLGKDYVAERFNIVGIWHAEYKAFRAPSMRLKLRHVDRFDYRTSTGEVNNEVTLKLPGISQKLREADLDRGHLMAMVEESVKLIWDHFLCSSNAMSRRLCGEGRRVDRFASCKSFGWCIWDQTSMKKLGTLQQPQPPHTHLLTDLCW